MRAMEPVSLRLPGTHGLTLHALEWSREGTPLLFLHGFSNDAHVWDWCAPVFAPHYRVVVVGHSLGGRVAMRFAGLFSERMAGLVIVDSAPELDARGTTRIRLDVQ